MSKQSFNKNTTKAPAPEVIPAPEATSEIAVQEQMMDMVPSMAPDQAGSISGEVDKDDIKYPQMKLAQSVGPLFEDYNRTPGELVLKNEISLWKPGQVNPVRLTVVKAAKSYIEATVYGEDVIPRRFLTKADADAAGLRTEWGPNSEKPEVLPQLYCVVLIEADEATKDHPEFYVEIGGKNYALATWTIASTAYKAAATVIITEEKTTLRKKIHTGVFAVSAIKVKGKANSYWQPQIKLVGRHSDELANQIAAAV